MYLIVASAWPCWIYNVCVDGCTLVCWSGLHGSCGKPEAKGQCLGDWTLLFNDCFLIHYSHWSPSPDWLLSYYWVEVIGFNTSIQQWDMCRSQPRTCLYADIYSVAYRYLFMLMYLLLIFSFYALVPLSSSVCAWIPAILIHTELHFLVLSVHQNHSRDQNFSTE